VDQREGNLLHLRLIDPTDPNAADDPLACLNADLIREGKLIQLDTGLATVDKTCKYATSYPQVLQKLQAATEGAKKDRLGIFEYVIQHIHSQS
jgi:staphylococcal nuclease domain-containing protein 1